MKLARLPLDLEGVDYLAATVILVRIQTISLVLRMSQMEKQDTISALHSISAVPSSSPDWRVPHLVVLLLLRLHYLYLIPEYFQMGATWTKGLGP